MPEKGYEFLRRPRGCVIGGGQAGLAMGYCLRQGRCWFVAFERGDSIAPAWRERWNAHPFHATPLQRSAGSPFPKRPGRLRDTRRGDRLP